MTDPASLTELSDLADRSRRYLLWAGFLLAAMLLVLLIDLQLKRQVARLAVDAAVRYGKHPAGREKTDGRGTASGMAATTDDSSISSSGSGDAVDGSTGVAAPADPAGHPKQARSRGVADRPPRDEP